MFEKVLVIAHDMKKEVVGSRCAVAMVTNTKVGTVYGCNMERILPLCVSTSSDIAWPIIFCRWIILDKASRPLSCSEIQYNTFY